VSPGWLVDQLARAPGVESVYLDRPAPGRVRWTWPLRVAVLDEGDSTLRDRLREAPGLIASFVELIDDPGPIACDLLLTPLPLRSALRRALEVPWIASAVIVLEPLTEAWERAGPLVDALLADVEAGALAFAPPGGEPEVWLSDVLWNLSHDLTLDVALLRAARGANLTTPLVVADPALLEETRLGRVAESLGLRVEAAMAEANGGDEPVPREVAEPLAAAAEIGFEHEVHGATEVARAARAAQPVLDEPPKERFIQADLRDERKREARALRTDALHELVVWVGPERRGQRTAGEVFPEHELPPGGEHRLTVVLTEPNLLAEPMVGEIVLPERGSSTKCSFWLRTSDAEGRLAARVAILHEGRVLQTVLLEAALVAAGRALTADDEFRVTPEAAVRPFAGLDRRTRFDIAFVVNHTTTGTPQATAIAGDRADVLNPEGLDKKFREIRARLEEAVVAGQGFDSLEGDDTRELLVFLGRQGALLRGALNDELPNRDLVQAERLQVVSLHPEAFLPLEFVYDRKAPRPSAKLCPNAAEALKTGRCDACPSLRNGSVVCPAGFWSLTKIIERYRHDAARSSDLTRDFRVWNAPVGDRNKLPPLTSALFAASSKVDAFRPGTLTELRKALRAATKRASQARSWTQWVKAIARAKPPGLLIVLPHTLRDEAEWALEIGKAQQLLAADVDEQYVGKAGPIVILIGCETSPGEVPFEEFPTQFRRAGASIVVATLTKVLGRHAAPVSAALTAALAEQAAAGPATFGEVFRSVRRNLLAQGVPMVLAVTAYGDADWILSTEGS
jgi:hypothetical protein